MNQDPQTPYRALAPEYDELLGELSEQTWRQGVLPEAVRTWPEITSIVPTVVDLGAGTGIGGRLLKETFGSLALVGVDRSAAMLSRAHDWYDNAITADVCEVPLPDAVVDLAVSGFDSLNYLKKTALAKCLRETSRYLKPNGWLIFDYSSPQLLRSHWRDLSYSQSTPEGTIDWQHTYDPNRDRTVSVVLRRSSTSEITWREKHVQYALDTYPLAALARSAGLRVERVRDLHRAEFSPVAHTHVWTLRKES